MVSKVVLDAAGEERVGKTIRNLISILACSVDSHSVNWGEGLQEHPGCGLITCSGNSPLGCIGSSQPEKALGPQCKVEQYNLGPINTQFLEVPRMANLSVTVLVMCAIWLRGCWICTGLSRSPYRKVLRLTPFVHSTKQPEIEDH